MKEYKNGSVKFEFEELNSLVIYLGLASEYVERDNFLGNENEVKELYYKLYEICAKHGLYDENKVDT